jgi:uncharacterized membrane protein YhaH (DUF805 family)
MCDSDKICIFEKHVGDIKLIKSMNVYSNSLFDNFLTDNAINNDINQRKSFYYDSVNNNLDNYIYIIKIVYFILLAVFVIKTMIINKKYNDDKLWAMVFIITVYPFTTTYTETLYNYMIGNISNVIPQNVYDTL